MDTVQVRINEEGTLRNQRFAFSNRFTLVTELLQNARRAGATLIEISHDPASCSLRVLDNGHGIKDFGKLLAINESGWGETLQAEEHPFGAGFSRCLYAATHCTVISRGKKIAFDTAGALARDEIPVKPTDLGPTAGTLIELDGVDLSDLETNIEGLCWGFPVAVEFNGKPMLRSAALDRVNSTATPIGEMHLVGTLNGRFSVSVSVYLQGFRVMFLPNYLSWSEEPNVLHLDSKMFFARLPDRDVLIDADVQEQKIRDQVRACWSDVLKSRKLALPTAQFLEQFFAVMRHHQHLSLLNDIDLLPRQLCDRVTGYPQCTQLPHTEYLELPQHPLLRQNIESGRVHVVQLQRLHGDNAAKWMLVRAAGYVVLDTDGLDPGHWVLPYVHDWSEDQVQAVVEAENVRQCSILQGNGVSAQVVLCDEISVQMGEVRARLTDEGLFHDGTLYIPAGEHSGRAVRQVDSYMDEHGRFHDNDLKADMAALEQLIRRLRMSNPEEAMRSLLTDARSDCYPLLRGLRFQVQIADEHGGHSVNLIS